MKTLILIFTVSILTTSCGKYLGPVDSNLAGNQLRTDSILVIYKSKSNADLYDFKSASKEYFSLDCGLIEDSEEQQECIDESLIEAINKKYDVCVIDPMIESDYLEEAKENCGQLE